MDRTIWEVCDMRMYVLIEKKKRGGSLSAEESAYMVREFVAGDIPDYQMSAMPVSYTHLEPTRP